MEGRKEEGMKEGASGVVREGRRKGWKEGVSRLRRTGRKLRVSGREGKKVKE